MEFLGSLVYTVLSLANNDTLTSSFPVCIPLISFSYPIALAKTPSSILNRNGESDQPLVPDVSGIALRFSPFN